MEKFKNLISVYQFLEENYDWTVLFQKESNPYVKIEKPDGEVELVHKNEIEGIALDMWNDTKRNGLDKLIIEEVEQEYFR